MAEKKTAPEGEGKSKKKLFILIGAAVLVVGLGVGGGFYFMKSSSPEKKAEAAEGEKAAGEGKAEGGKAATEMAEGGGGEIAAGIGPMVEIEPFVINILDDQSSRYLKAALTLELDSAETTAQINARMPQIRDAILLLIGNKTYDELRDLQGKLQLRAELTAKLNGLLEKGQVKKIYFTDFVVQ